MRNSIIFIDNENTYEKKNTKTKLINAKSKSVNKITAVKRRKISNQLTTHS